MNARQSIFPLLPEGLHYGLSDEPVLIDGMKLEFDEKVALYPAAVEVSDDSSAARIERKSTSNGYRR